jgi:ISXO2-like transposase domain
MVMLRSTKPSLAASANLRWRQAPTFVGGKRAADEPDNKTIVFGMLQRDGRLLAAPIPDVTTYTVEGIINENVPVGTIISTDQHWAYHGLRHAYEHGTVNHSAKEYEDVATVSLKQRPDFNKFRYRKLGMLAV